MTHLVVAHSTVKDGSMLNREDMGDAQVFSNRKAWLDSVGIPISHTYRVTLTYKDTTDFCRYREVSSKDASADMFDGANKESDALITTESGVALFLPIADCIGAVLFDEEHKVLMLSHLGRHSLEQNGGVRSVEYLTRHYGTDPKKIKVWLSAAIGKDLYKIYALDNKGMKEVLFEQLKAAGVDTDHVQDTPYDTGTHDEYYSYSEFLKGNKPENGRHAVAAMMAG